MVAVILCSHFGAQENKVCHCFHCFPIYLSWSANANTWIYLWGQAGAQYDLLCFSYIANLSVYMCAKLLQSWPTLCNPMDCSLPGSSVHGDSPGKNTGVGCHALLQGIFPTQGSNSGLSHCGPTLYHLSHQGSPRILEWVAYPFSKGSSWPGNWTRVSCIAGKFFTSWATREALFITSDTKFT